MSLPAPRCHLLDAGGELNHERLTCTFKPQGEKKDSCRLLLNTVGASQKKEKAAGTSVLLWPQQVTAFSHHPPQVCLGEKAKEEVNRVEVLPSANQEDRKLPVTIASLRASVLPMVSLFL